MPKLRPADEGCIGEAMEECPQLLFALVKFVVCVCDRGGLRPQSMQSYVGLMYAGIR